jgi:hypothetical protein
MVGQRYAPADLPPGERPCTLYIGGWAGPRTGLDGCGKSLPHRDSIPGPPRPQRVAVPTELSRPTHVCIYNIVYRNRSYLLLLVKYVLYITRCFLKYCKLMYINLH